MKQLIISEKPDLAMKIVKGIGNMDKHNGYFENNRYIVTFAFGHLFVLKSIDEYLLREKAPWKMSELPFVPDKFEYIIKNDNGVKKQYKVILSLYKRNDISHVVNAGDPDREGSVIILNIVNELRKETGKNLPVERIWLKATTPEYVQNALHDMHPEEYYGNMYEEGLARTFSDWIYGINFTRFLSLKSNSFLPVGRVLIPIVKYIYDRDLEIKNFKQKTYYEMECTIKRENCLINCKVNNSKFEEHQKNEGVYLLTKLLKSKCYVKNIVVKEIKKQPPKLFSLDTLQNKMANDQKISPADTLKAVQQLYEDGIVTYPRTNTEYLIEAEIPYVQKIVDSLSDKYNLKMRTDKRIFDDKKTEGHTALIVTGKEPKIEKYTEVEKVVYKTIYNRFICNFLNEDTVVEETSIEIVFNDNEDYSIELKGNVIKKQGFFTYEKPMKENFIPSFEKGEHVQISDMKLESKVTTAPKHISEAELNQYLKNPYKKTEIDESDDEEYRNILRGCEIGTVATRASIIENAIRYGYINREKGYLISTEKGQVLIRTLTKLGIELGKDKTVKFSMILKDIYMKKYGKEVAVKKAKDEVESIIKEKMDTTIEKIEKNGITKCPCCKGEVLEGKENYYCNNYKIGCKFQLRKKISGKTLTNAQIKQLIDKRETNLINGFVSKSGKKFNAKIKLNKEFKTEFEFKK